VDDDFNCVSIYKWTVISQITLKIFLSLQRQQDTDKRGTADSSSDSSSVDLNFDVNTSSDDSDRYIPPAIPEADFEESVIFNFNSSPPLADANLENH